MVTPELRDAFRFHRHNQRIDRSYLSVVALAKARLDVAAGKRRYPAPPPPASRLTAPPTAARELVYIETPDQIGARVVGFSDEIVSTRDCHTGWFADMFQDTTYRGAVLQLPARKGVSQFLACYQDSENIGYIVDLERGIVAYPDENGGDWESARDLKSCRDAAWFADSLAESQSEEARQYNEAWQAGARWSEERDESITARTHALALLKESRILRRAATPQTAPAICAAIRAQVDSFLETIDAARTKQAELIDSVWTTYHAAFNDGAGESVLAVAP